MDSQKLTAIYAEEVGTKCSVIPERLQQFATENTVALCMAHVIKTSLSKSPLFPYLAQYREAMHSNDNRTLLEDYFRSLHPRIAHLPDYGLRLEPEEDARFRARAEAHGLDYDRIKRDFSLSRQVIPARPHKIGLALMDKNAIPVNALKDYFAGMISGAIHHAQREREKAATK